MGLWGDFGGRGKDILMGKYIRPQNCMFSAIFCSRSDAPCGNILHGYCHLPQTKVWTSFGGPQLSYQKSQENAAASRAPLWTLDNHMEKSLSFCNVTPGL